MKELKVTATDGFTLSGRLFEPEKSNGKLLLINSATGVKQQVYFSFSKFLAENGFVVITYDYRGIGESKPPKMKGFEASMRMWGTHDYAAITSWIKNEYADYEKYCLGHSVGALILGMNPDSTIFKEFIFIATQKAYVGNLRLKTRLEAFVGFGLLQPISTSFFGYFPAHRFGLGESLPSGSAYDWRTLILNKKSTNKLLESTFNISKELSQKAFVLQIEDDKWVTVEGVQNLLSETYPNLKAEMRYVKVSESEAGNIGHINFFRSYNKKLWNIILNEIS